MKPLACLVCAALLAGCASGGGSGSGSGSDPSSSPPPPRKPDVCDRMSGSAKLYCLALPYEYRNAPIPAGSGLPPAAFESWSKDPFEKYFLAAGTATGVTYSQAPLTVRATDPAASERVVVFLEYEWDKQLRSLELNRANQPSIFFGKAAGDSFSTLLVEPGIDVAVKAAQPGSPSSNYFLSAAQHGVALAANPFRLGWDYQSFGVWNDIGSTSIYSASFGAATPASAVPLTGSATFNGKLAGLYVSPAGEGAVASANLTVNANFSARTLGFASTSTQLTPYLTGSSAAPQLNLSGTLTYAPSSNSFSGTLTNAGGTLSGTSSGRFYGPAAQELGGTFVLKSPTTSEAFTGAYGAKR